MKEFTIGRNDNNNYPVSDTTVSGNHAHITIGEDFKTFTIQDLNSTNGTKVNGQAVISKKLNKNNRIQLGTFSLNIEDLFNQLEAYVLKNRIDFSKEFNQLKDIEDNYLKRKYNTNKYFKLKSGLIRGGVTIGLMALLYKIPSIEDYRIFLMIGVGAVGGIISTASISEKNVKHKLDDLYIDFSEKFKCPKCDFDMTSKSWKFWRSKKNCPKCKCNWIQKEKIK